MQPIAPLAIAAGSCSTIAMLKQSTALPFLDSAGVSYLAIDGKGGMFSKRA
jgi:thiamine biosynthesis lipoprotein